MQELNDKYRSYLEKAKIVSFFDLEVLLCRFEWLDYYFDNYFFQNCILRLGMIEDNFEHFHEAKKVNQSIFSQKHPTLKILYLSKESVNMWHFEKSSSKFEFRKKVLRK